MQDEIDGYTPKFAHFDAAHIGMVLDFDRVEDHSYFAFGMVWLSKEFRFHYFFSTFSCSVNIH